MGVNYILKQEKVLKKIARDEMVSLKTLQEKIKTGETVVLKNKKNKDRFCAVGGGLSVKVNANIGTSEDLVEIPLEISKIHAAEKAGADAIMDLSTGGDIDAIRKIIIKNTRLPLGTVPVYQTAFDMFSRKKEIEDMTFKDYIKTLQKQAEDGVDFFTIHCGLLRRSVERLEKNPRRLGIVSRGGAFMARWIRKNKKENFLYDNFNEIMDLCRDYNIAISLGDGLRPGSVFDATDAAQLDELYVLGELVEKCFDAGVPVMVEGPGHVPLPQIKLNIQMQKKICHNAPFYILGPLPTDSAAGYDHIACAIGGAWAAYFGADFLCYVTPAEHIGLPNAQDVFEGTAACKIAAHIADVALGNKKAIRRDSKMTQARADFDWKKQKALCFNKEKFDEIRNRTFPKDPDTCTMCGPFCAIKTYQKD